jgi:hypothetical protein
MIHALTSFTTRALHQLLRDFPGRSGDDPRSRALLSLLSTENLNSYEK